MKKYKLALVALAFYGTTVYANPPITVYDGFWTGRAYCGENISPGANPKNIKGFNNNKVTFNVVNGEATSRTQNAEQENVYKLTIRQDGVVNLVHRGSYKNDANRAWLVDTTGNVRAGLIASKGAMTTPDKTTTIRNGCGFEISNNEVIDRLAKYQEEQLKQMAATNKPLPPVVNPAATVKPAVKVAAGVEKAVAPLAAAKPTPKVEVAVEKSRVTPPPVPVTSKDSAPARVAAIGNVVEPMPGKTSTKVTSNPIDKMSKKSSNDVWINFNPSITVQERQFCRLIENYRVDLQASRATQNQIKINETNKNIIQAINSLMPDGKFQGWVMRSISVGQASDGSADILFQLPCDVIVGSNSCDPNPKNFYGTIAENSRLYTELTKMTVGDFALVSGDFVYADPKAFDRTRSVASYGFMKTADHCKAKSIAIESDFFGIKMTTLSMIK
jgi:hypothetical protein